MFEDDFLTSLKGFVVRIDGVFLFLALGFDVGLFAQILEQRDNVCVDEHFRVDCRLHSLERRR